MTDAPLAGLRVLELARILAGPWAGQTLADLGADVVKVERKGAGDDTRAWGPPFVPARDGGHLSAAYFHSCNRGKRSIEADFDNPDDIAMICRLAARADVVIENFKVGGLNKYGLDAESLMALNPRLIYCSITGFGQDGPYAPRAGYDFLIQGMGGAMSITGDAEGQPTKTGFAIADIFTGLYASVAILAALNRRRDTGAGAVIDCALLDTQVAVNANQAMNYLVSGKVPGRMGNAHPNLVPYEVFPVADGHIIIATGNDGQYRKLMNVLGQPELGSHPDYIDNASRIANRSALIPLIGSLSLRFAKADLLARLEAAGVPAGPINAMDEVFADPQVIHRGMRVDLVEDQAAAGTIPSVRSPILIDGAPQVSGRASPALGAHTAEVLADPDWT
ncbi:MAG TPA: CaiB/BaiF CoA-transferase family protein [Beijerinckiaceae bacterium]|nr:CaiB/BaiF CoA-transferase family protein [Beijerinckiaceae bacterium]